MPLPSDRHEELLGILAGEPADAWCDIVALWAKADRVYTLPAGPNGFIHPAYELVALIVERIDDFFPYLKNDVTNENPQVCAYCLTCLGQADKLHISMQQIAKLKHRTEVLEVVSGCFGSTPTLSRFFELSGRNFL